MSDDKNLKTPRLEINLHKIQENARILVENLAVKGISVTGITKASLGCPKIAKVLLSAGVNALGDSRIQNIMRMRNADITAPITLIRTPMMSQIEQVVEHATISFNTELDVINALSESAQKVGKNHGIILMLELGDLREGIMPEDIEGIVSKTLKLPNIKFKGIGANLACRSGVVPDAKNMKELSDMANSLDAIFGFKMDIVSGGNSANLGWALKSLNIGRINNLCLGESFLLGLDPLTRKPIEGLYTSAFTLMAEVIESKIKPTKPWGKIGQSAFGKLPPIKEQGNISQILLAIGEQDTDPSGLTPPLGMEILGASSDHIIVKADKHSITIGNKISFKPNYAALLRAMTSPFIEKCFIS
jgi:predicted amino acid racemase